MQNNRATIIYIILGLIIMQKEEKIRIAIEELNIKINKQNQNDKYELGDIIVQILSYPILKEAEMHRKANRLGNFDLLSQQNRLNQLIRNKEKQLNSYDNQTLQLCHCCGHIINEKNIPFLSNLSDVKLGIGVRLYFTNLFYHIFIFALGFFLFSIYSITTNVNASNNSEQFVSKLCSPNDECSTARIGIGFKLMNNENYRVPLAVQSVLGLVFVLIWGFIGFYRNSHQRQLDLDLKKQWVSASQFTLMIKNFPKVYLEQSYIQLLDNMRNMFTEYQYQIKSKISFEVVKVGIGYPLYKEHQQQILLKQKNQTEMQTKRKVFIGWLYERQKSEYFDTEQQKRNEEYYSYYQFLSNIYNKSQINKVPLDQKNIIFVTLRYSKARQIIQELNKKPGFFRACFGKKNEAKLFPLSNIQIEKAPQPSQIIWQNIGVPKSQKLCRKILIYIVAMILIIGSLIVTFFLGTYQVNHHQYFISIIISLVITLVNYIIEFIIITLSYYQNQFIKSKQQASIGIKIGVGQILNCIGVPIALTYISSYQIFSSGALVTNVFYIGLINMILPLGRFIDPYNILLKIRQKYYQDAQKRLLKLKGQKQLNEIYTSYEFQLGYQYAYIIKTSFFTAFFMTLQPMICLFAPLGLAGMYLTNKYRLFYRFVKPKFNSNSVNTIISFILKFSVIGFSLGQLFFVNFQDYTIRFNLVINWITLGLAILFAAFPLSICKIFYPETKSNGFDYHQKQMLLTSDYDRSNPITKSQAIEDFRVELENYERKCHLQLPQKSQMIKLSLMEIQKYNPMSQMNIQKTKIKIRSPDRLTEMLSQERFHL